MGSSTPSPRTKLVPLALVAVLATSAFAAPRHRAVRSPADPVVSWLANNAHPLAAVELPASSDDLEPLRTLLAGATVVGLGDDTHGTREFYTVKLRVIDSGSEPWDCF